MSLLFQEQIHCKTVIDNLATDSIRYASKVRWKELTKMAIGNVCVCNRFKEVTLKNLKKGRKKRKKGEI